MDEETARLDFEVWASRKHYSLRCLETGEYEFPDTHEAWKAWLEATRRADKRIKEMEDRLFSLGAMNEPPCFCCGYNGSGYYQPDKHKCAKRHHKLAKEE